MATPASDQNYDPAGNLSTRTNNELVENFTVNGDNELSSASRNTNMTVTGTSSSQASSVTVNGVSALLYGDYTFAATNMPLVNGNNTFTAIAHDSYGRNSTNAATCYLPANVTYNYDQNGNLLSDGTRNFAYDDENQLIAVWVTNAWESKFIYDGKMRRRIRQEYTWSGGAWVETNEVRYVYDGMVPIQERDINNLPVTTRTCGNDLSGRLQGAGGIGGLLARTDNSQLIAGISTADAYYHADGNGNVTCLINSNQTIAAKYEYDPFGNILSLSGALASANLYCFSSKEYHPNSGLVYYGYRFYDPNLQRWINRDRISERGGLDLYEFVFNDAVCNLDGLGDALVPGAGTPKPPRPPNPTPTPISPPVVTGPPSSALAPMPEPPSVLAPIIAGACRCLSRAAPVLSLLCIPGDRYRPPPPPEDPPADNPPDNEETCYLDKQTPDLFCQYICPSGKKRTVKARSGRGCVDTMNFPTDNGHNLFLN